MRGKLIIVVVLLVATAGGCASSQLAPRDNAVFSGADRYARSAAAGEHPDCIPVSVEPAPSPNRVYTMLPVFEQEEPALVERARVASDSHPAIHGPYSLLLAGDFIAPSMGKLDEAYGVDTRLLIRAQDSLFLGGSVGYARMKHHDSKGLIEGELQRYTVLFWAEYRLTFGKTTWSPSVDFGIGPGWFVAEPVPLSDRRKAIESANCKLKVRAISTAILRGVVQFRLPVHRSTDMSISEGNADLIVGIGGDFGKGNARYTINDFSASVLTKSRGTVVLDAFHAFVGLSFRF